MWYFAWKLVFLLENLIFNKTNLIKNLLYLLSFLTKMLNVHQISISRYMYQVFTTNWFYYYQNTHSSYFYKSYEYQKISFQVSWKITFLQCDCDASHASIVLVGIPITYLNQRASKSYHRLLLNCNSTLWMHCI